MKHSNSTKKPYLEQEFEAFIKLIGDANIENWTIMADVLGVSRETVVAWKKHPRAKEAISNAINRNLEAMTQHGKRDWKMYREKLKMLGILDIQRNELTGKDGKDLPTPILSTHVISTDNSDKKAPSTD